MEDAEIVNRVIMDAFLVLVIVFAVFGWGVTGYLVIDGAQCNKDCRGLVPYFNEAVKYYNKVCEKDINNYKLDLLAQQLLRSGKLDLNSN